MKRKRQGESKMVVGVAWYTADQWARLLEVSADRDLLEDSHAEWERSALRALKELERVGMRPKKVALDLDELLNWCLIRNLPLDGEARSTFVAEKLREADKS